MPYDVDKRPAAWTKARGTKVRNRVIAFAVLLFAGTCVGVMLQMAGHPRLAVLVTTIFLVLCLAVWAWLDRKADEAVNWLRGARAEEAIGELLEQLRPEGFIPMHDIGQAGEGNIDHLVWGPTGVFMIESKYRGYRPNALKKARRQAAKLHDELGGWVVPVICIHERDREPFKHDRVWIVPEQYLLKWIRSQKSQTVPFERLARYADTVS